MKTTLRLAIIGIVVSPTFLPPEVARGGASLWVGVFENVDGGSFLSPTMASPHVRVAFEKTGAQWVAATTGIPETMTWTVVFDGRALGTITSVTKASPAHGDINTEALTIAPTDRILVKQGAASFSSTADVPVKSRPLVLVSEPNFRDPEGWKPTELSFAERRLAVKSFRKKIPTSERCDQPEEEPIHRVPDSDAEIRFQGVPLKERQYRCGHDAGR